ncbi:hypothetical protein [Nostoc sp. ATCC 53789]|uniref:hypothetical protein n=1 Tax=unclassified Nostoc TaxID=2593658 RepID=UPI00132F4DDD|nr:hypothetical protein [Nostoc sp. ATCC 53789]QHG16706.1 hypothetical protein GJB62_12480 [Nostoc sp. ATCC 53789]
MTFGNAIAIACLWKACFFTYPLFHQINSLLGERYTKNPDLIAEVDGRSLNVDEI